MRNRRSWVIVSVLLAAAALPYGDEPVDAQTAVRLDRGAKNAAMEQLRERAERVQERRQGRITQAQREEAAARAKAAREKTVPHEKTPKQNGRGVGR